MSNSRTPAVKQGNKYLLRLRITCSRGVPPDCRFPRQALCNQHDKQRNTNLNLHRKLENISHSHRCNLNCMNSCCLLLLDLYIHENDFEWKETKLNLIDAITKQNGLTSGRNWQRHLVRYRDIRAAYRIEFQQRSEHPQEHSMRPSIVRWAGISIWSNRKRGYRWQRRPTPPCRLPNWRKFQANSHYIK